VRLERLGSTARHVFTIQPNVRTHLQKNAGKCSAANAGGLKRASVAEPMSEGGLYCRAPHPAYARAIADLKESGELGVRCRCRPVAYLNNIVEQDHRFIKKRNAASLWFRSVKGAVNTIAGYESVHMIKKGQVRWLAKGDIAGQVRFIHQIFGIVA
jgi:hypothetical protein